MICPTCDLDVRFIERGGGAMEPHGEYHYDVWLTCPACCAETNERELAALERKLTEASTR